MIAPRTVAKGSRIGLLAVTALSLDVSAASAASFEATIKRTRQGIAHVVSPNVRGAGYGVGYARAEDAACTLAERIVTVRGERSRWFGADGRYVQGIRSISNLQSDILFRTIGDLPALRSALGRSPADVRALYSGFVAGYNRFLRDQPSKLTATCRDAPWVRPMTMDDALLMHNAAMRSEAEALAASFAATVAPGVAISGRLAPPAENADHASVDSPRLGSNGWAFGGDVTANGRGLLLGNPHFPWQGFNRFHRIHVTVPGKMDVAGAGLLITPLLQIGFNKDVAWTHTVNTGAHSTLFELKTDPSDPTTYFVDGKARKMKARTIEVPVKDGPSITHIVYSTRFGDVISIADAGLTWIPGRAFALRDGNHANLRGAAAWMAIGRAHSVGEIRRAVSRTLGIPWVNTIAADRNGDALYADVTTIPNVSAKKLAACGMASGKGLETLKLFVLDGSRSVCDWDRAPQSPVRGLMPASDMAVLATRKWVQNSNDSYWLTNPATPFSPLSPLLGPVGAAQSLRTRSGIQVIEEAVTSGKLDQAKLASLIFANRVHAAELVLDDLITLCRSKPALADACGVLATWDRKADIESRGAALFFAFWRETRAIKDLWVVPFDPKDPTRTPRRLNVEGAGPAILAALDRAIAALAAAKVPIDAPLGSVQVAVNGADRIPLHGGPGGAGVLNMLETVPGPAGFTPFWGSSYMQIITFDDSGPRALTMLTYSQSPDPGSRHSTDGTEAYSAKQWISYPYSPVEIEAQRDGDPVIIEE